MSMILWMAPPLLLLQEPQQPSAEAAAASARHLRFASMFVQPDPPTNTARATTTTEGSRIVFRRSSSSTRQTTTTTSSSSWTTTRSLLNGILTGWRRRRRTPTPNGRVVLPRGPLLVVDDLNDGEETAAAAAHHKKNATTSTAAVHLLFVGDEESLYNYPAEVDWNRTTTAQQRQQQGQPIDCTPPAWTRASYPTCNTIHETMSLQQQRGEQQEEVQIRRLGNGYYRTGYMFEWPARRRRPRATSWLRQQWSSSAPPKSSSSTTTTSTAVVLKMLQGRRWWTKTQLSQINREAVLLGHYFASSPRMANLYAFCGGSVVVEPGQDVMADRIQPDWIYHPSSTSDNSNNDDDDDDDIRGFIPQDELDKLHAKSPDGVYIHNRKTLPSPHEKLHLALSLLESINLLHEFPLGPILHDDISLDQWLQVAGSSLSTTHTTTDDNDDDDRVLLNDLNTVVPLEWSPSEQAYCRPPRSVSRNFRPPEFFPSGQAQGGLASDVWSMGCVLYCILTGT